MVAGGAKRFGFTGHGIAVRFGFQGIYEEYEGHRDRSSISFECIDAVSEQSRL
jgi:hypothetical protein